MRLKPTHVVVISFAAIGGFIAFALTRGVDTPDAAPDPLLEAVGNPANPRVEKEAAFLAQIRGAQEKVDVLEGVGAVVPQDSGGSGLSPNLEVDTVEIDVGVIPNNERSLHPFVIRNTGAMPLKVHNIQASCNCTQAVFPETGKEIPPGGEISVPIAIDPALIAGFEATRFLTIASNDPDTPSLRLSVTCKVEPEIAIEPAELHFGDVAKGKEPEMKVVIRQLQEEPYLIETVNGHGNREPLPYDDDVAYTLAQRPESEWQTPGKAEYELTAKLTPRVPSGEFIAYMHVKSNLKRVPWMPVKITANVLPPYEIVPKSPVPLAIPNDGVRAADIVVTASAALAIENVSFDAAKVLVELADTGSPNEARLSVKAAPGAPVGPLTAPVEFDVRYEDVPYHERIYARTTIVGEKPAPAAGRE